MAPDPPRHAATAGALVALCLVTAPVQAAKPRTDVITLSNGDRTTGEIKNLYRGLLEVKTDHVGTLEFEWPSVESIESRYPFEVFLNDGRRIYGSLRPAPGRQVDVVGIDTVRVGLHTVVEITPLDRTFWEQLNGSMSIGLSFSQSNNSTTWSASADVAYLTRSYGVALSLSSYLDAQKGADTSTRNDLGLALGHLFAPRWRVVALGELFQSDQLGVRLRTTVGGGIEHDVVNTNRNLLSPTAGMVYSNTRYQGDSPVRNEVLARLGLRYSFFTFGHHKTSLGVSLYVLPSLNDWGHLRLDLNAQLRVKLFRDFYWSADAYENYDNDPPPGGAENDSGASSSLAWTF
jgi:hypothetical protein